MAEEQSLPDELDEIAELTNTDIETSTTEELLDYLTEIERFLLEEEGNLEIQRGDNKGDQGYDNAYSISESLGEVSYQITRVLRERLDVASSYDADAVIHRSDENQEKIDGIQIAVDKLKKHGHGGQVEGDKVVYPD